MRLTFLFLVGMAVGIVSGHGQQLTAFHPGAVWPDNNGVHINAHGGGILYDKGVYYWFGEFKTAGRGGNRANVGVSCYSSVDLYNCTFPFLKKVIEFKGLSVGSLLLLQDRHLRCR